MSALYFKFYDVNNWGGPFTDPHGAKGLKTMNKSHIENNQDINAKQEVKQAEGIIDKRMERIEDWQNNDCDGSKQ